MYEETHIVYNQIKTHLQYNDETLDLLGYSKEKIDKAIQECTSKGMSRKQAAKTVFDIWMKADPTLHPASAKEMCLMGFQLQGRQWVHTDYPDIIITFDQQREKTFKEIEDMVLAKQNDSRPPHEDSKTE